MLTYYLINDIIMNYSEINIYLLSETVVKGDFAMARKRVNNPSDRLPPYLTYATWQKLLEKLRQYIPSQLDRSYFNDLRFSISNAITIRGTLLFLRLIDADDKPNKTLRKLVESDGENRKPLLKEIVLTAYEPIIEGLNLADATSGQLQERFRKHGAVDNIGRKCLSFFLALAKDADITLSPSLEGRSRVGAPKKASLRSYSAKRTKESIQTTSSETTKESWLVYLLEKFPAFDPGWTEEIKSKWFDDFRELMKISTDQKLA